MRAILTYHSLDDSGSPISVAPDAFRAQLAWLARGPVRVVTVPELLDLPAGAQAVALTFDDGFRNFAEVAAPLLAEYGMPATLFVVTGHVGGANDWNHGGFPGIPTLPLLDWEALGRLANAGVTLGAHTRSHVALAGRSPAQIAEELEGCVTDFETRLALTPTLFAYPYGSIDDAAAAQAASRFAIACTTELATLPAPARTDRARVPRLEMYYYRDPGRLRTWGSASFRGRLWIRRAARRLRRLAQGSGRPA